MAYHFKNLVFEGGGVKGIAYVGALEVLDKEGILKNIKRVAGTSAGAMVAVLVGLNYTTTEISEILWDLNFKNFLDDNFGMVRDIDRLINEYGWYKGDFFRDKMAEFIEGRRLFKSVLLQQHPRCQSGRCCPYLHVDPFVFQSCTKHQQRWSCLC